MIYKCKMCGGALELGAAQSVALCPYCGTQQTLPRLDDERRTNLYDRAGHFRRNNDFDKAMAIYEQILNEDPTDAEAYWSLVLCRFGIEYVEDPATRRRLPTVNRAQFTSVFDDEDYKSALAHADTSQRTLYEQEAHEINEIQKGILAISQKEEPFDVFICYKETDQNGRRTQDSVLATELYQELCREGFRVFFSRITLEDKLGIAYEPYIFAALQSARVMVVLGTRAEHFNAVWVKNEWSRYLALIKQGARKTLIPAYRDMDPYDLPEEFSHLQAQDMSRLGFMQDLTRGIRKIVAAGRPKETKRETTVVTAAPADLAPLLKRAFMCLEDGDFELADSLCEQALNRDPENAEAYLAKLMIGVQVKRREDLALLDAPFENNTHYRKILRFGSEKLRAEVAGYLQAIAARIERKRVQGVYETAVRLLEHAVDEEEVERAKEMLLSIPDYLDAQALADSCPARIESIKLNQAYETATSKSSSMFATLSSVKEALVLYESLGNYRNSIERAALCRERIKELEIKAEQRRQREAQAKRYSKFILVALVAVTVLISVIVFTVNAMRAAEQYPVIDGIKYEMVGDTYHVISYSGTQAELSIPASLYGKPVTKIAGNAFQSNTTLTSVTVPNSVEQIDAYAFFDCQSLAHLSLPFIGAGNGQITHFGYIFGAPTHAQNGGYIPASLKTVVITGGETVSEYAFKNCTSLTKVTLSESIKSIEANAFLGCTALTEIDLGSVQTIGASAFSDCVSLSAVHFGSSLQSIGDLAFAFCEGLTDMTVPDSVTHIGRGAFNGCTTLASITLPFVGPSKNATSSCHFGHIFGASSYSYNSTYVPASLRTVTVTGGTTVSEYAFKDCASLARVTLPDSINAVGRYAFEGCYDLAEIVFPEGGRWYRTAIYSNWQNKSSGEAVDMTVSTLIASYLADTYCSYYWYKI